MLFVQWPCSLLTLAGTETCRKALRAIQQFTTFNLPIWERAAWIAASAHLYNGFDLFVSPIQAFAWDALPEKANNGVLVTGVVR